MFTATDESETAWTPPDVGAYIFTHIAGTTTNSIQFVVRGNDYASAQDASATGWLDLRTVTRFATSGTVEQLAYSPRWGNAANCTITETVGQSAPRMICNSPVEGGHAWSPKSGPGVYTLTHTAGDLAYTVQFPVLGDDTVAINSARLQTDATWTADKVWLVTGPLTIPSGVALTIEAGAVVKFMPGASLTVASGGNCMARGVIFTHVNDDAVGGDTLYDGEGAVATQGDYTIAGNVIDDDTTEYRYMPPQELTSNISSDTRLRGYRTYVVSNSVTVASGAVLTIPAGTILKFNTGCSLTVNSGATLDAQGTRAAPIIFTSQGRCPRR